MPKRQLSVPGRASEQASQHCGWRSADVVDGSKIFMASWEIADAVELLGPQEQQLPQVDTSADPAKAA